MPGSALDLLVGQPLLLLFLVLAVGYAAGRLRVAGVRLGIAAVLFAGLAAGMLDPRLALPEFVRSFGLVLFVYAIGISSGPGFIASFRRRGLPDTVWTIGLLSLGALGARLVGSALGLSNAVTAGLFCGALTNTPALAAIIERLPEGAHGPVVGYSIAYPAGVLGLIVALAVARRRWHGELAQGGAGSELDVRFVEVLHAEAIGTPVNELLHTWGIRARFVRKREAGAWRLLHPDESLALGDIVTAVGMNQALNNLVARVGVESVQRDAIDRNELDMRRIFVSDARLAGKSLAELKTLTRFGALVTRVRRGDTDLVPDGRTVLELGDRVRVIAPHDRLAEVSRFFGDSYRALAEIDAMSFGLGVALGLLVGMISIPLPGGASFHLGPAGGPLLVGLALGALGRTGPLVWQVPFSAGLTLRQLGLALFLAAVGVSAGAPFARTLATSGGAAMLGAAALITVLVASLALWTSRAWLKATAGVAMGLTSGVHTQPAGLAFSTDAARDESPALGYSTVSPIATLTKILLAQMLLGGPS